jgi:hypothetical protein
MSNHLASSQHSITVIITSLNPQKRNIHFAKNHKTPHKHTKRRIFYDRNPVDEEARLRVRFGRSVRAK